MVSTNATPTVTLNNDCSVIDIGYTNTEPRRYHLKGNQEAIFKVEKVITHQAIEDANETIDPVGIRNVQNDCYVIVVIQALLCVPEFSKTLLHNTTSTNTNTYSDNSMANLLR